MIFDVANDLPGRRLHLMHLSVVVPSLVELVMHLTRMEVMP